MYGSPEYDPISDSFKCEICGKWFKGLGYHISNKHKIPVREYNKMFGFDLNTTWLSKNYREKRQKYVEESPTYKKNLLEKGKEHRFKEGEGPPDYERSPQTKERLRNLRKNYE